MRSVVAASARTLRRQRFAGASSSATCSTACIIGATTTDITVSRQNFGSFLQSRTLVTRPTSPRLEEAAAAAKKETAPAVTDDSNASEDAGAEFVMPTYTAPTDYEVTPAVKEVVKDILKLSKHQYHMLGYLLAYRLEMTSDDLQKLWDAVEAGRSSGGGAAVAAAAPVVEEKTDFDVKLTGFDPKSKIKLIKEVRAVTEMGLKEAKALVDNVPQILKKALRKEQAEDLKAKLEALGGMVELE
jgi:large subunit ribosomal protein L7/L12